MGLTNRFAVRRLRLPGNATHRVSVQRGLRVSMPDGAWLRADRFHPRDEQDVPLVVMTGMVEGGRVSHALLARQVAERGYQVLLHGDHVSCVGGDRLMDAEDKRLVMKWIQEQDWFPGSITTLSTL